MTTTTDAVPDPESTPALQARRDAAVLAALRSLREALELHLVIQVRRMAERVTG